MAGRHTGRRQRGRPRAPHRLAAALAAVLAAAACSHTPPVASTAGRGPGPGQGRADDVECVPFARARSGIQLYGNAADWWWKAAGLYARSHTPAVGSVLVLGRTSRLVNGHVGVVTAVDSPRDIRVTQANWVRGQVFEDMPVIDVSAANDWTLVRVWWPPAGQMGATPYPAYGFILPEPPRTAERPAVEPAIAAAGW